MLEDSGDVDVTLVCTYHFVIFKMNFFLLILMLHVFFVFHNVQNVLISKYSSGLDVVSECIK